jgi:hypothetical protein
MFPVLPSAPDKIAANARIQGAIAFAGKDIDGWLLFHKQ